MVSQRIAPTLATPVGPHGFGSPPRVEWEVDTPVDRVIAPGQIAVLVVVSPILTASGATPEASFRYSYRARLR